MRPDSGAGQWLPAGEGAAALPRATDQGENVRPTSPRRGGGAAAGSCPRLWKPEPLSLAADVLATSPGRGALSDGHPSRREGRGRKAQVREPRPRLQEAEETGLIGSRKGSEERATGPRPLPDQAQRSEPAALGAARGV